ncbi:uncharacterized protein LOC116432651 [Nomia melanderi]|uniref:uncharacterized protein LOC116432651 n=1 Tax=Nomia melanderi TaxID=2448451 RepID=UPI0013046CA2|nr:bromodomain-containing protein DDB_G0270170-like [Nomia melanderi]
MSIHSKSGMKCSIQYGNKKTDNIGEAPVEKRKKSDTEVDPLKTTSESRFSGHSTPISKKGYAFDIEDSPELDYHCSPISLPCTQDGNEVAWDWQVPTTKSSKPQTNLIETPKRTKQLQKKRNSNSPLLQKPLKRKQMRMQNIESIGKFTAELKALTEKMKSLQENNDVQAEQQSKLLIELDSENNEDVLEVLEVDMNNDKHMVKTMTVNNNDKKNINIEDLFDDSIEDGTMEKCSQEVEEKFKINKSKGNAMELSIVNEEEEVEMSSLEKGIQYSTTSSNSVVSFKNSRMSKSSSSVNMNAPLKTYSNNSSKTSSNSSISSSKDTSRQKSLLNNNVINAPNAERMLQTKDFSVFPDDSFDDCLATCIEDDKLLSKSTEYDFSGSNTDCNLNCSKKTSRQTTSNIIQNMKPPNNCVPKRLNTGSVPNKSNNYENSKLIIDDFAEITAANRRETIQKSLTGNTALENRKFFKTKSLSDQYLYQGRNSNVINKTNKPAVPSDKRSQSNTHGSSVSTSFPITKNRQLYDSNNLPSNSGGRSVCTLNGLGEKNAGNSIVKYKSTSNLSSIRETSKATQSVQCTPEEIERKRLEAKMRLEAKRKLLQGSLSCTTSSEAPVKKCVKR